MFRSFCAPKYVQGFDSGSFNPSTARRPSHLPFVQSGDLRLDPFDFPSRYICPHFPGPSRGVWDPGEAQRLGATLHINRHVRYNGVNPMP
jgi:hypothetical protein